MPETRETTVLFIFDVNDRLKEYLTNGLQPYPQVELIFPEDTSEENLLELAPKADIMVGWRPSEELLMAAENLTLHINPGAGIQHLIDLFKKITRSRDILLANGHGNSYFTAQHAVALLLALTNKVIPHHNWLVAGEWRKGDADARSIPLRDRSVGLLGYGAVNQKVHRFLSGFDIEFSVLRRDWTNKSVKGLPTAINQYDYSQLPSFLKEINTLIVAVPLTSLTEGMIKREELELLGEDGLLVNVSRGPVIDEASLYQALTEQIITGAAIDVWYNYRPEPDEEGRTFPSSKPFYELSNVVLSPHRGASPMNDLRRWNEVVENIRQFALNTRQFINLVDLEQEY